MATLFPIAVEPQDVPAIPGLTYLRDYISEKEQNELTAAIDSESWDTSWKRRRQLYGWAYGRGEESVAPIPDWGVAVDDSKAITCYANFCRVTGTPEELILDFGLNSNPMTAPGEQVIEVQQRLVLSYLTAKRMLQALGMSVQRHEQAFGMLETDVQKRVVGQRMPRSAASAS